MGTPLSSSDRNRRRSSSPTDDDVARPAVQRAPGKSSRAEGRYGSDVQDAAARGVSGGGGALPFMDVIQRSFGRHEIGSTTAHVGGAAADACEDMGAQAYATGTQTAFASSPDLHTAAHEAAHVVQQRGGVQLKGGVGQVGDEYERNADAVADKVVAGESAESLLDGYGSGAAQPAVQMKGDPTLKKGSSGKAVKKLQQRLNAKETTEPPLGVDGTFGEKTEIAVIAFQHKHTDTTGTQLEEDGIVGPLTWGAINLEHATPEIDATKEALGEHVAIEMNKNNDDPHTATRGVHYDFNYKANHPDKWKDDYSNGYADPTYFERIGWMDWQLKPGKSAAAAVQSWLHGLTIAECHSAIIAMESDAIRAAIGDKKFDERYGSTDKKPTDQRLRIKIGRDGTILENLITKTPEAEVEDGGSFGNRPLEPGDWCYFYNHPQYLLKHPGGAFQGENSIYVGRDDKGKQRFSGMGVDRATEIEMMDVMVSSYNQDRDDWDFKQLEQIKKDNGGVLPPEYDEESGHFPKKLATAQDVLDAPEYELHGTKRKGGFIPRSGRRLDAKKVEALK